MSPQDLDAELRDTAARLLRPGRGVLAADESISTCEKRLASVGVSNTEENRRALRELLLSAPGLEEHLSAVVRAAGAASRKTAPLPLP